MCRFLEGWKDRRLSSDRSMRVWLYEYWWNKTCICNMYICDHCSSGILDSAVLKCNYRFMPCNIPAKSEDVIYTVGEAWDHAKYACFTVENTVWQTHFAFTNNRYNSTNCLTKWMAYFCRSESFISCYMSHKSASVNTAVNSTNISLVRKGTCIILNNPKTGLQI